jgi:DegV family protein with EDD domain
MRDDLNAAEPIPFYINVADETFVDDGTLQVPTMLEKMRQCKEKMTSACPGPAIWKDAFIKAKKSFAITLSKKLSGSYSSASAGLKLAQEESGCEGYVFDSQSAACGEVLLAHTLDEFIKANLSFDEIIRKAEAFIANMKTYFVLDDVSNLVKNGRMSKITGLVVNVMSIKPVLGAKEGEIALVGKVRGVKNIADKLIECIGLSGRKLDKSTLVISHCNNIGLASEIAKKARERFRFRDCKIIETGGLSSFYACDKGVILSF